MGPVIPATTCNLGATMDLLSSKIQPPPARPKLIRRDTLIKRLNSGLLKNQGFTRKLTLIAASAGAGKTSLAADWLRSREPPFAWLSLDALDNDLHRFLTYLFGTLQAVDPSLGTTSQGMLKNPQAPPPDQLLPPLFGDISTQGKPLVLALDDLHVVYAPPIHDVLNFLFEYQPQNLHLVLITREDPPIPLARMRAKSHLLEIRQDDLRFSTEEGTKFLLEKMGLQLSPPEIRALVAKTEGWAVGLQLAALAMQASPDLPEFIKTFTGSHRFVLDYLIDEVLEGQPETIQDFCLQTAILDQLTAPLCQAVTGREDSSEVLRYLDASNLFLNPLDQTRTWFRYHRLFAELLLNRLRLREDFSEPDLHQKASRWLAANDNLEAAVPHALAAKDWEQAAGLINEAGDALLKRGEFSTIIDWCKRLPEKIIHNDPQCCLTYAWPLLLQSQIEPAAALLERAEHIATDDPVMLGEVAAARAFLAQILGDGAGLVAHSEKALKLLPAENWNTRSVVAVNLGLAYWHLGRLEAADNALQEALIAGRKTENLYAAATAEVFIARTQAVRGQLCAAERQMLMFLDSGIQAPITALVYLDLATIRYEMNDLATTRKYLEAGREITAHSGNPEFRIAVHLLDARLLKAIGAHDQAHTALQTATGLAASGEVPDRTSDRIRALEIELGLSEPPAIRDIPHNVDAHPFYRYLDLAEPRILIRQGQPVAAYKLLRNAHDQAAAAGWEYGVLVINILEALAAPNKTAALDHITQALTLAEPEGYLRSFVDAGPGIVPALKSAARQGISPSYVGQLLAALEAPDHQVAASRAAAELVEPLTDRELEVLRLVAAGLTNRAIAGQLIISISTVKSHVHHICGKLGATNRTQAVAQGRELGLI